MSDAQVTVEIKAKADEVKSAVAGVKSQLEGMKSSLDAIGSAGGGTAEGLLGTALFGAAGGAGFVAAMKVAEVAIGSIVEGLRNTVGAAAEAEDVNAKLAGVLAGAGENVDAMLPKLTGYADAVQSATRFNDEWIKSLQTLAIGLGASADETNQLIQSSLALSAATGKDAETSLRALIGATEGNFTSLQRMIPALKEAGDATERWAIINGTLERGQGALNNSNETLTGKWERFKNTLGEIGERIGSFFVPALKGIVDWLQKIADIAFNAADYVKDLLYVVGLTDAPSAAALAPGGKSGGIDTDSLAAKEAARAAEEQRIKDKKKADDDYDKQVARQMADVERLRARLLSEAQREYRRGVEQANRELERSYETLEKIVAKRREETEAVRFAMLTDQQRNAELKDQLDTAVRHHIISRQQADFAALALGDKAADRQAVTLTNVTDVFRRVQDSVLRSASGIDEKAEERRRAERTLEAILKLVDTAGEQTKAQKELLELEKAGRGRLAVLG